MRFRKLGSSDLEISEISLGSWLTYAGGVQAEQSRACTDAAFDAGINFFDTANVYGQGAAESAWGEILAGRPRDSYVLATKVWGTMSDADRGLSGEQIAKQIDASLRRLRTDYVDLYQAHRFDTGVPIEETIEALQKVVETFWAFPPILLAIAIVSLFGQNLPNLIIALTIQRWIPYARLTRAQALSLRSRDFVSASMIMGGGTVWILRRHIIPNVFASAVVVATFSMATAIIAEASLSFLGLGVPPGTATWGGMLADGRSYITRAWWLAVFPGLGIFVTVIGLNLLGDWLRDQFDPKADLNLV